MVHTKSEYNLGYLKLSNEVRRQIWEDNFTFRQIQKHNNLSDHYWKYQLMEYDCDCENYIDHTEGQCVSSHLRSKSLIEPEAEESNRTVAEYVQNVAPNQSGSAEKATSRSKQPNGHYASADHLSSDHIVVPYHGMHGMRLNPSLTRDARKQCKEGKRTHFAAYGWNDSGTNIGDKRTHNVDAPASEVYPSALHAMENRHNEVQLHLATERSNRSSLLSLGPVNHSRTWMTEYQEKYCQGHKKFSEPLYHEHMLRGRSTFQHGTSIHAR